MNVTIYFAVAIAVSFITLYVKQIRPDFALCITLAGVIFIFSGIVPKVVVLIGDIRSISFVERFSSTYIMPVLKIIGIAYLTEISSNLCADAGERAIANHVETVGKLAIAIISLPIVEDVFGMIIELLE